MVLAKINASFYYNIVMLCRFLCNIKYFFCQNYPQDFRVLKILPEPYKQLILMCYKALQKKISTKQRFEG